MNKNEETPGTNNRSRRELLRLAGLGLAGSAITVMGSTVGPTRAWAKDGDSGSGSGSGSKGSGKTTTPAAPAGKSDVQYDIGAFVPPPISQKGILFGLGGPTYTAFFTATIKADHTLVRADQDVLRNALDLIERTYAFSPSGVFPMVAYGLGYFSRLPSALVDRHMPKDTRTGRSVLQKAVLASTDIDPANPNAAATRRARFNVPCVIENNDLLFSVRSDSVANLADVEQWLQGRSRMLNGRDVGFSGLSMLNWTSSRTLFVQMGLPHSLATAHNLPYASLIHPESPMWFGIADQNVNGAGPAAITTFQGNASARITSALAGDYFDNGTIQPLNHNISDLAQWYLESSKPDSSDAFKTRLQYMFRATNAFGNGGGTPFWENAYLGKDDAEAGARGLGTPGNVRRIGHLTSLQRSSRAADGTPMHARMDGPGFDGMDVPANPDGSVTPQPKLHFSAFVPSSDFFTKMREDSAATDLCNRYGVTPANNGLERFITATRRQFFLMPPRRNRSFPLLELA